MNRITVRSILATLSVFPSALAICLLQPVAAPAQQKEQIIELSAKKYEYSSSPLRVKAGTKILLRVTAMDHDHGFKIAAVPDGTESSGGAGLLFTSPQDCWQLKKGETSRIEFVAQTPGTYTFRCCHSCGLGHRGMKGQIIVEQ